jgi:hypothetical protein
VIFGNLQKWLACASKKMQKSFSEKHFGLHKLSCSRSDEKLLSHKITFYQNTLFTFYKLDHDLAGLGTGATEKFLGKILAKFHLARASEFGTRRQIHLIPRRIS